MNQVHLKLDKYHLTVDRRVSNRLLSAAIIVLFCSALGGCKPPFGKGPGDKKNGQKEDKKPLVYVDVHTLGKGSMERVVKASTDLIAEESVSVFARTSNFLQELLVEEGDVVKKGDVLIRLQNDIQLTQLQKAQLAEERTRIEYERLKSLATDNIVSEQEFKNAELDLQQQRLLLEEAQRELEFTVIKAPIDGTVTDRLVNQGDIINSGSQLIDLVNFDSIKAPIYLPESELPNLSVGLHAKVSSPAIGDTEYTGNIERISPLVDARSGTVEVMVSFPNSSQLRPGMYVNVEVVTNVLEDTLLIPRDALIHDADQSFVYRLVPGKEFPNRSIERVLVEPILDDRDNVTVDKGLEEGDRIVIIGKSGLRVDTLVRLPGDPEEAPNDPDQKATRKSGKLEESGSKKSSGKDKSKESAQ